MKPQLIRGYTCSECGQYSPGTVRNDGIGPYECHGVKGNDVDLVFLSTCCDAPMVNGLGIEVGPSNVDSNVCDEP